MNNQQAASVKEAQTKWLRNATVLYVLYMYYIERFGEMIVKTTCREWWLLPGVCRKLPSRCWLSALFCHEPASSSNPRISAASLLWLWNGGLIEDHTLVVLHTLGSCLMPCTVLHCTVLYCTVLYCATIYCLVLVAVCALCYSGCGGNIAICHVLDPPYHPSSYSCQSYKMSASLLEAFITENHCPDWTMFLDIWSFIHYDNKLLGQLWK